MISNRAGLITVAFAVLAAIMFLVPLQNGLTAAGRASLAVCGFAIIVWGTQVFPDAVSGLIILVLLAVSGAVKMSGVFSGYANTALWLMTIGFMMAACVEKCGLAKRIALQLVKLAGGSPIKTYWAIAAVCALMVFFVPSITARTLLILPIILGVGQAFHAEKGNSNITKALLFITIFSGTMM
ncbi:MAG: Sodium:sulfate symporter transrane, partial [Sporomusa sp.]|nr:Sodium:sulfate symporter transrane [Sporomusa sp.]